MTELLARGSQGPALLVRGPAHAVVAECLRIQSTARKQPLIARLFGRNPVAPDARSWYRGALGELQVARALRDLPEGWTVLHSTGEHPLEWAGIDHVAIGPTGVFTIATKNHSGQRVWVEDDRILVNGHRTDHIRDARWEAARISRILGAGDNGPVIPVIAIVDPGTLVYDRKRAPGIRVIDSTRLVKALTRGERVMSDKAVAALTERAIVGGTWHDPDEEQHTLHDEVLFARLQHDVDAARHRRIGWIAFGSVAMLAWVAALVVSAIG
jgi:hypothetical protein